MSAANVNAETVPILGADADGKLDPGELPRDFRNSWEDENLGTQTREVIDEHHGRLLFMPFFSISGQASVSLVIAIIFNALIFAKSAEMLAVSIPLSLLFFWNRIAHLRDRNAGLPIIVYSGSTPPDSPVHIHVNEVTALIIRENDKRDADGPMIQLYLGLSGNRFLLVMQDQLHRRRRFIKRVASIRKWIETHIRGIVC